MSWHLWQGPFQEIRTPALHLLSRCLLLSPYLRSSLSRSSLLPLQPYVVSLARSRSSLSLKPGLSHLLNPPPPPLSCIKPTPRLMGLRKGLSLPPNRSCPDSFLPPWPPPRRRGTHPFRVLSCSKSTNTSCWSTTVLFASRRARTTDLSSLYSMKAYRLEKPVTKSRTSLSRRMSPYLENTSYSLSSVVCGFKRDTNRVRSGSPATPLLGLYLTPIALHTARSWGSTSVPSMLPAFSGS